MKNNLNQFIENCITAKLSLPIVEEKLLQLINENDIDDSLLNNAITQLDYLKTQDISHLQLVINRSTFKEDKTVIKNNDYDDKTVILSPNHKNTDNTEISIDSDKTQILTPEDNEKTHLAATNDPDQTIITEQDNEETILSSSAMAFVSNKEPTHSLQPGSIINNRFELIELLGRGGMGTVFKAKDKRKEEANDNNPYIAIKFLNDEFKQHPQSLISLQRECKKSQALAHPNIITVHDFDRDNDTVYMTMELMDGEPLDELLAKHKDIGLEHSLALNILKDVSQALAYAHEKNLVHSDFKPGNVFVTNDGRAKVLDFGIARAVKYTGDSSNSNDNTVFDAGELGGLTPAYASCEMLAGETPAPADDVYALGCVAYQLFTGRHPFNKLQADLARDKKLTVAPLKQLERKQAQALLNTLKFDRKQRTPDAKIFVSEFFEKKHVSKGLKFTLAIAAILLIGFGGKLFVDYQDQQTILEFINTINQGDDNKIALTLPKIQQLSNNAKETVLLEVRDKVIDYYASQALPLVDQNVGKYDFPQALMVLSSAKTLYPDSAKIQDLIDQLQSRKNQLLNTLARQINEYVDKGELESKTTTTDIHSVFDLIKIVDPESKLLNDQRLQLAYSREIKSALNAEKLKTAALLIDNGLSLFPTSQALNDLKDQLQNRTIQAQEDKQLAALQLKLAKEGTTISDATREKAVNRHKEKLETLIASPFNNESWVNNIQSEVISLRTFLNSKDSTADSLINQASKIILDEAKAKRRDNNLSAARRFLNTIKKINPNYTLLSKEQRALAIAERQQNNQLVSLEKAEKINSLKQTLLTQAKANDVKEAKITYRSLKSLASGDRFLTRQGPEAIADAYLRLASGLAERNNFAQALSLIDSGLELAPRYPQLNTAKERYTAEVAFITLSKSFSELDIANVADIQNRLSLLNKGFPKDISKIRTTLSNTLLNSIKNAAKTNQTMAKEYAETAQIFFPENNDIAALTKRSSKFQAAGGQPCKSSYARHGERTRATCYDMLENGSKAPLLVVVPGINKNDPPFAVSKYEISISDINHFCEATNECPINSGTEQDLPVVNISIKTVQNYTQWLSKETHSNYRLPTSIEWLHAANSAGEQPKKDFNCRLTLGSKQIKGLNLINTQSGKQNGWGLKNYVGNAQEFSIDDGKIYAHGGAYTDSFSQCGTDLKRRHNGKADDITGFRIIKAL